MRIAIIEAGVPPEPLSKLYAGYGTMSAALMGATDGPFETVIWPTSTTYDLPEVSEFDGLLITGSPASAYDEADWIRALENLIRTTAKAEKPQVGICFGHQLIAQALGGEVIKAPNGWGVGVHSYDIRATRDWMIPPRNQVNALVSHQDQVVTAPEGALCLGGSQFCPIGILEYSSAPILSFQQHPEFEKSYSKELIALRHDKIGEARAQAGLDSLATELDGATLGQWIANFFMQHLP